MVWKWIGRFEKWVLKVLIELSQWGLVAAFGFCRRGLLTCTSCRMIPSSSIPIGADVMGAESFSHLFMLFLLLRFARVSGIDCIIYRVLSKVVRGLLVVILMLEFLWRIDVGALLQIVFYVNYLVSGFRRVM